MRSRKRLAVAALAGVVAAVLVGLNGPFSLAALLGWDVAALMFSAWVWAIMIPADPETTATHATREDPGRGPSDAIVLAAAVASLVAVGYVLVRAGRTSGGAHDLLVGLGLLSVAISWFTLHTLFTLRYARLYYAGPDGGIQFNQAEPPRYLDFAYVAFTIGMTFQVSDTDLTDPGIRATALRQGLLAFLFVAIILAATINLVASLLTAG
jgi:uncharacterized membrane protein